MNFSGMKRHPKLDLFFRDMRPVVRQELCDKFPGQDLNEDAFCHRRWYHDKDAITAVFMIALGPRHTGIAQRLQQSSVKTIPHHKPVLVGATTVSEPLHVHDEDRSVHSRSRVRHGTFSTDTCWWRERSMPAS
jgi:hypothetical protein